MLTSERPSPNPWADAQVAEPSDVATPAPPSTTDAVWVRNEAAWRSYRRALVVADAALLGAAFFVAARLRVDVLPLQEVPFDPLIYTLVAAAVIPGLLAVFWLRHAYDRRYLMVGPDEYARIFSGCTYGTLLVVGASFLYGSSPLVSRVWLMLFWVLSIALACCGRFALRRFAHHLRQRGLFIRRVLIAGANDQGLAIMQQLRGPFEQGVVVLGFLDDYLPVGTWLGDGERHVMVHGHPYEAESVAAATGADLLIVVPAALTWETQRVLNRIGQSTESALEVRLAPTQYDLTAVGVEAAPLGFIPLLRLQTGRVVGTEAALRAAIDVTLAALLLLVLLPLLLAVLVQAAVRGIRPLIARREILGQRGRVITLHLLHEDISQRLLVRGVPSLWSVIRGEMSLVGPRPVLVGERADYDVWDEVLLAVKPGLTGPWRLVPLEMGPKADASWVRNWTIWQHLFVLFQTARLALGPGRPRNIQRWAPGSGAVESTERVPVRVSSS